jgi:hypothetical protein
MARMYPDIFPRAFDDGDPEFLVYQTLRRLPDSYVVFYSKRLQGASMFGKRECEIDFIIWNQRDVLICLEVKGGTLSYDGPQDRWLQNGVAMAKGPDRQASSACHALLDALRDELRSVNTGWALCFPQCNVVLGAAPTSIPLVRIIDESAMADVATAIARVEADIRSAYRKSGVTPTESNQLFSRLTSGIGFVTTLGVRIAREAGQLIQVTDEQLEVLNDLELNPRMIVHGAAGTGKTILAQEFAKRLASQGRSVLLLFYNRGIAKTVRLAFERHSGVQVSTFSSFAKRAVEEAFPEWWDAQASKDDDFWNLALPAKLLDVPKDKQPRFDAIVVDEGQDFKPEWFEYLATLLTDHATSNLCVLLDEHQDIFGHWQHFPASPPPFKKVLTKNCRNTKKIVNYLNEAYPTGMGVFERSPTGAAVEERTVRNAVEEQTTLVRDIKHLVGNEKVPPGSIVILLNGPKAESCLADTKAIAGYPLESTYAKYDPKARCIYYSTIDIFKGLEADVSLVILGDTVSPVSLPNRLYVEGSRAKHVLYVYKRAT